jgi:tripartite-type tricarboxylate transporter receptor subunit TctC
MMETTMSELNSTAGVGKLLRKGIGKMVLAIAIPTSLIPAQALATPSSTYPSQTVRIVLPFPAGSSTDVLARVVGQKLQEAWSQPVIVDNKPGALGTIGASAVAKSRPDGHTLLLTISGIVQAPALMTKIPYDVVKDFVPVTLLCSSAVPFAIPASLPPTSLKDFVAYAKANSSTVNFGSWGSGSTGHMLGMLLNRQADLQMPHIPYKGLSPLVTDLLGGQIAAGFTDLPSVLAQPKLRVLAVSGPRRIPELPGVPTFTELGYKSFDRLGWYGVFLPAGTPKPVVQKVHNALSDIFNLPDVQSRLKEMALVKVINTPEQFQKVVQDDADFYGRTYKQLGLELN